MEQIPPVLINNERVNDPPKIADAVNTLFLKITENVDLRQARGDAISFIKLHFLESSLTLKLFQPQKLR
jgi:hypothetical protein